MIQNIFISSSRNGTVFVATVFLVVLVLILRLDSDDLYQWLRDLGASFKNWYKLGWFLFAASVLFCERRMKRLRQSHAKEMDRISEEKSYLQNILTNRMLSKSKKK